MTDNKWPLNAIVLAAGQAKRFGADKRFAKLPTGKTVLSTSLSKLAGLVDSISVAISEADAEKYRQHFPTHVGTTTIHYRASVNCHLGMGSTLADACRSITQGHLLIVLADMPYIQPDTIAAVISGFYQSPIDNPIAYPLLRNTSSQRPGHPVLFHQAYWQALCSVSGDRGAREIVNQHRQSHQPVITDDLGVIHDIDIPADIRRCETSLTGSISNC